MPVATCLHWKNSWPHSSVLFTVVSKGIRSKWVWKLHQKKFTITFKFTKFQSDAIYCHFSSTFWSIRRKLHPFYNPQNCQLNLILSPRTSTKVLFSTLSQNKPSMSPSWFSSALTWLPWWWKQMTKVKKKWTSSTKSTCFLLPSSPGSASSKCWLCDITTSPTAGTFLTLWLWFCPL